MIEQVLPLVVVVALVAAAAWWWRRTDGAARALDATFTGDEVSALGLPARRRALLLFTAPGCSSCAAATRVLDGLSAQHDVAVVKVDVTDHPQIAAAHHVYRAPTVFVVDERARALARISGVPRPGELASVLAPAGGTAP